MDVNYNLLVNTAQQMFVSDTCQDNKTMKSSNFNIMTRDTQHYYLMTLRDKIEKSRCENGSEIKTQVS